MNHIESEKLDIYILNKSALSGELASIEKHLVECSSCKNKLVELQKYYEELDRIENQNDNSKVELKRNEFENIRRILSERSFRGIESVNGMFKKKEIKNSAFRTFIFKIQELANNIYQKYKTPSYILAYSIGIVIAFTVVYAIYFNINKNGTEQNNYVSVDTVSDLQQEKNEENINVDTIIDNTQEKQNQIKTEKKRPNKTRKQNFFAAIVSFPFLSGFVSKGENGDEFIMFLHKEYKTASLFVLKNIPDRNDLTPEKIKEYNDSGLIKYLIVFPPSQLSDSPNKVCDVIKDGDVVKVTVSESESDCTNNTGALLNYEFSDDYEIINIWCNKNYRKKYAEKYKIEENDVNEEINKLIEEIRTWDGERYIKGIEEIKKSKEN